VNEKIAEMTVLGVIPARGGSRGIPRKNIRELAGKPLIAHTISEAKMSKLLDRVIVTTDDEEIATVADRYGAEIPFLRPKELAQDDTTDLPVFQHALHWLKEHESYTPEIIVHLRPTSPLRKAEHVDKAIKLLIKNPWADSVRSVSVPSQNPFKMWKIDGGFLKPLIMDSNLPEPYNAPRQKLPNVYWQNGYVDVTRYETIMMKNSMTGDKILPLIIDQIYPLDIDNLTGFEIAEALIKELIKDK